MSLTSPALAGAFFTTSASWSWQFTEAGILKDSLVSSLCMSVLSKVL